MIYVGTHGVRCNNVCRYVARDRYNTYQHVCIVQISIAFIPYSLLWSVPVVSGLDADSGDTSVQRTFPKKDV